MRLYSNPTSPSAPISKYAPIFKQPLSPCHLSQAYFICYRYMHLLSNSNAMQAPYAPIFDGRLLLGMSLFSKKYSNPLMLIYNHSSTYKLSVPFNIFARALYVGFDIPYVVYSFSLFCNVIDVTIVATGKTNVYCLCCFDL